ncbi:MAG: TetR/AcrR family transcriptional regulator [Actinomycetota bacterium]
MPSVKSSRRTGRSSRTSLEQIVKTAVDIVDGEGADALTIRHLAEACAMSPMGLYRYVRNRNELLDLVVEYILEELPARPLRGDWKRKATQLFAEFRRVALRHPGVSALGVARVSPVPAMARFTDRALAIMEEAGLGEREAVLAYDSLLMFTIGSILWQVPRTGHERARLLDAVAGKNPPATHLARHSQALGVRDPDRYYSYGFQSLLTGLESRITVVRKGRSARRT